MTSARGDQPVPERFDAISARDVGFTYPSRSEPALQDVSVELPEGQVIALVGENGSGKTTLAKILAGLYPPGSGSVFWDGSDIAQFDPSQLRARMAILFQDFVRYQLSASENIGFGNGQLVDDQEAIIAAAKSAGAHSSSPSCPRAMTPCSAPSSTGAWTSQVASGNAWRSRGRSCAMPG